MSDFGPDFAITTRDELRAERARLIRQMDTCRSEADAAFKAQLEEALTSVDEELGRMD